jgi:DNA topoisomerase-1
VARTLVIVESPAKARTIGKFLGSEYVVESSIGHIRDLPHRAADVPPKFKKEKWAKLGVDVENDFRPLYVVDPDKKDQIAKLKKLLEDTDELLLATDEDREGESIAWHLIEVLKPKVPVKRMVFHEITKPAIEAAIKNPRGIDRNLVDAQEARRILDRLYGYEVSPVLWKKVMPRLSAGRVQSVATRIVVERERARIRFRAASYWDIDAVFSKNDQSFDARLATLGGARVAAGRDFGEDGKLSNDDVVLVDEARARKLADDLAGRPFEVTSVEQKPYRRTPSPPFMTSTLQQEAGRKLRFSASRTMRAAQRLYEGGYITYMRTDSTTLSESALRATRRLIEELYGADNLPASPRSYASKVKNAQEAHEAIRPSGDSFRSPDEVSRLVEHDEARVYELIWKRTVASQMEDARGQRVSVRLAGKTSGEVAEFTASGLTIDFPGFLLAYVEGSDNPAAEIEEKERHLPPLAEGESISATELRPEGHETQPPARFTEASLVKRLEELGVGRPSTYASTLSTIQDRGYVWRKGPALVPTYKAMAVVTLLEQHFGHLVDYAFTAKMEDELDDIANGREQTVPYLRRFYYGDAANDNDIGLQQLVIKQLEAIDARAINTLPIGVDSQSREMAVRVGRYGPYLQRGEDTVGIPDDLPPDELTPAKAEELLSKPSNDRELGIDPATGKPVLLRIGRFGAYVQLGNAKEEEGKPKTASLFSTMTPETLTFEEAQKLLSLPRVIGVYDGEEVTAAHGRYGPYITKGKEKRSLTSEAQIFELDLDGALHILAQPRQRQGRRAAAGPLKELGLDPVSGKTITLRQGRFGLYVTDGDTNASLRAGDLPEALTPERAQELLQMRRDRGPGQPMRRAARGRATKGPRAPKSKAPPKKAAKPPKKSSKKKSSKKKSSKKKGAKGRKSIAPPRTSQAPPADATTPPEE